MGGWPRVVADRRKVAQLRAAGKSLGEIAAEMHLSKSTVARITWEIAAWKIWTPGYRGSQIWAKPCEMLAEKLQNSMTNRQPLYAALLLEVIALVFLRQVLGGQPVFRSEFVIEHLILLLALASALAPSRFQPLLWSLIACLLSTTMALIAWTIGARRFPLPHAIVYTVVFALGAILNAFRALIELSKLRKFGPTADSGRSQGAGNGGA